MDHSHIERTFSCQCVSPSQILPTTYRHNQNEATPSFYHACYKCALNAEKAEKQRINDEYERDTEALGGQGDLIGTSKCGKLEAYRQGLGVEDVEKRVKRSRLQRERENNFRDVDAGFKERWGGGDPSLPVCEKEEPGVGPFMLKRACELRKLV